MTRDMTGHTQTHRAPASGPSDPRSIHVHLLTGTDEYRVSEAARELVNELCPPEEQSLGLEIVEGRVDTPAEALVCLKQCLEGIRTIGLFNSGKCVWLRGATCLRDSPSGRAEAVKLLAQELAAEVERGLPEGHYLVISAEKIDGRSALAKACKARGGVQEFGRTGKGYQQEREAQSWARQAFRKAGLRVDGDTLKAFIGVTGPDSRQILQEVQKLDTYLGQRREIALEDVRAVVSPSRARVGWDLADAFGNQDLPEALRVVRQLLFQRESPVGLVAILQGRVRDLLIYRQALDEGWLRLGGSRASANVEWSRSAETDAVFSRFERDPRQTHPYRALLLSQQARRFSLGALLQCQAELVGTQERLVSTGLDSALLLELTLVRLLGPSVAASVGV